ncbi:MAG: hypothetical protein Q8L97_11425 [Nitrosomonas sp.]|uniref:hypothetical protein n=1 Tax=Nitrosomonas sp. TaxID=42353 RepID=UPI002730A243|nr:hypothetical protein [Nitrosomonas sp.]MDP1550745.1 hypothetical protein [Nitrosomonas sp.]MDP2224796.1 hypothetical protein [Nitrosomonas sp.]
MNNKKEANNGHSSRRIASFGFFTIRLLKEALIKLIRLMVRQAHHERNQYSTVRTEPVEGLNQSFLN